MLPNDFIYYAFIIGLLVGYYSAWMDKARIIRNWIKQNKNELSTIIQLAGDEVLKAVPDEDIKALSSKIMTKFANRYFDPSDKDVTDKTEKVLNQLGGIVQVLSVIVSPFIRKYVKK